MFFKSRISVTLLFSRKSNVPDMSVPQLEMESPMPTSKGYNIPDVLLNDETITQDVDLNIEQHVNYDTNDTDVPKT